MSNRVVVSPERCLRAFKIYFEKLDGIVNQKLESIEDWRDKAVCDDFAERIMSVLQTNCPHLVDQISSWAPEAAVGIGFHNTRASIRLKQETERPFQSEEQRSLYVMLKALQNDLDEVSNHFKRPKQEWKYSVIRVAAPKVHEALLTLVEVEDDKKKLAFRAKDLIDPDEIREARQILKNVETQLILTEQLEQNDLQWAFRSAATCFLK